ncbi:unnamed protein product [Choristocarpus tenellus]
MQGETPLHKACEKNDVELVRVLLSLGHNDVNKRDHNGCTPLFTAVRAGSSNGILSLLLGSGADVDARGTFGIFTPLAIASGMGNLPAVRILAAAGACLTSTALNATAETPLHLSAKNGATSVVCFLLAAGCWPEARDSTGMTPLAYACSRGRMGATAALLKGEGWALSYVPKGLPPEIIEEVVSFLVASPNTPDYNDETAVFATCEHRGTPAILGLLKSVGANLESRNHLLETPLHVACRRGRADLVAQLLHWEGAVPQTEVGLPKAAALTCDARGRFPGEVRDIDVGVHEALEVAEVLLSCLPEQMVRMDTGI